MEALFSTSNATTQAARLSPSGPSFLDALIDPGVTFAHPEDVARHPGFTNEEKRTILLSWIRDELVIEEAATRTMPALRVRSRLDAVADALSGFDVDAAAEYRSAAARLRAGGRHRPPRAH